MHGGGGVQTPKSDVDSWASSQMRAQNPNVMASGMAMKIAFGVVWGAASLSCRDVLGLLTKATNALRGNPHSCGI
jgi:hypothetical protein